MTASSGTGDLPIEPRLMERHASEILQSVRVPSEPGSLAVSILGAFQVRVAGKTLPLSVWRGHKGDDLLRL